MATQQRLDLLGGVTSGEVVQMELLKGEDGEVRGTEVRVKMRYY